MRITVFTLSLAMAYWACVGASRAGEMERFPQVQYAEAAEEPAELTGAVDLDEEIPWYEEIVTPRQWFDAPAFGHYGQADALWLARIHDVSRPIAVQIPNTTIPVLSSQQAGLADKFDLGTLFTLGCQLDKVAAVELTFFGFNDWNSQAAVTAPGTLILAGTLSPFTNDFNGAQRMSINYSARLFNAEANYKQTI